MSVLTLVLVKPTLWSVLGTPPGVVAYEVSVTVDIPADAADRPIDEIGDAGAGREIHHFVDRAGAAGCGKRSAPRHWDWPSNSVP